MKNKLLLIMILINLNSLSQTKISYVSIKKDTLILPNNQLGITIFKTWFEVPKNEHPIILISSPEYIAELNKLKYKQYANN